MPNDPIIGYITRGRGVTIHRQDCGNILRLTAFQTVNADGFGDYFDGLPADCAAVDDLNVAVGDDADPNMIAARAYLDTGACPAAPLQAPLSYSQLELKMLTDDRRGPPWRQALGAW